MQKGNLVVFEGTDGSGKATQTELLCQHLLKEGIPFRKLSFPRYGNPSAAMIEEYLHGNLGKNPSDVNAFAASTFYAVDRYASYKQDWGEFYEAGGLVIADRYTTSNAIHQAVKLPECERQSFLDWLFHFEYTLLGLPKPSLVYYLDMPTEITAKMMRSREEKTQTSADIHEKDLGYLSRCREISGDVAKLCGWQKISCASENAPRTIEDIHRDVWNIFCREIHLI